MLNWFLIADEEKNVMGDRSFCNTSSLYCSHSFLLWRWSCLSELERIHCLNHLSLILATSRYLKRSRQAICLMTLISTKKRFLPHSHCLFLVVNSATFLIPREKKRLIEHSKQGSSVYFWLVIEILFCSVLSIKFYPHIKLTFIIEKSSQIHWRTYSARVNTSIINVLMLFCNYTLHLLATVSRNGSRSQISEESVSDVRSPTIENPVCEVKIFFLWRKYLSCSRFLGPFCVREAVGHFKTKRKVKYGPACINSVSTQC